MFLGLAQHIISLISVIQTDRRCESKPVISIISSDADTLDVAVSFALCGVFHFVKVEQRPTVESVSLCFCSSRSLCVKREKKLKSLGCKKLMLKGSELPVGRQDLGESCDHRTQTVSLFFLL